jgi:hypothetical protein
MAGIGIRRVAKRSGVSATVLLLAVSTMLLLGTGPAGAANSSAATGAAVSTGELTGTVNVTGAPTGFSGFIGVGGCPASTPKGRICNSPQYALTSNGGTYELILAPGRWTVGGFYEIAPFGGEFIGKQKTVTIAAGATVTRDFSVTYTAPGTVSGKISVRGLPKGLKVTGHTLTACPSYFHNGGGAPSIVCVQAQIFPPQVSRYSITTLPPGTWLLYPGYTTAYGPYASKVGIPVKVTSGGDARSNVSVAYHKPTEGLLTGTVTVTGAPKGFGGYIGVGGCPAGSSSGKICASPQYSLGNQNGGTYQLSLSGGSWKLAPFYEFEGYSGQFLGASSTVQITAGKTITRNFTLRYIPPATVIGKVNVKNVPTGLVIDDTLVLACPSAYPFNGTAIPQVCVLTGAALGSDYSLTTLPPGSWLMYPGYQTNETEYLSAQGARVTLTSNRVATRNLTVAYQS